MNDSPVCRRRFNLAGKKLLAIFLTLSAIAPPAISRASAATDDGPEATSDQAPTHASTPFRMGFSMNVFTNVNVNEAKASIKVWAQTVARERGIAASPDTALFRSLDQIAQALATGSVDLIAFTTTEYWKMRDAVEFDQFFIPIQRGYTAAEYVVLARRNGSIQSLRDLRGCNLIIFTSPQLELGETWLDTTLLQQGFPIASEFTGRFSHVPRLSGAVLPVFFGKADACLVDRVGFDLMAELNPQISKQLVVVASSPQFVAAVAAMRRDCTPAIKTKLISALSKLHESSAGQQLMTIFQMERLELAPASALQSACDLLAEHQRLLAARTRPADEHGEKQPVP